MSEYNYPTPTKTGFNWNIFQNIERFVGIRPVGFSESGGQMTLMFGRDLTVGEKTNLDAIMAGDPTAIPTKVGTRAVIKDIWETRAAYKQSIGGFDFWIYYRESVAGSGVYDEIVIDFLQTLTTNQKRDMKDRYTDLMSEEA